MITRLCSGAISSSHIILFRAYLVLSRSFLSFLQLLLTMKTTLLGRLLLFTFTILLTTCQSSNEDQHRIFQDSNQHHHHNNQLNIKTLLEHHDKPNLLEAHTKKFHGETLAYVTPWNNRGKNK
jgi:hypothetical protein